MFKVGDIVKCIEACPCGCGIVKVGKCYNVIKLYQPDLIEISLLDTNKKSDVLSKSLFTLASFPKAEDYL